MASTIMGVMGAIVGGWLGYIATGLFADGGPIWQAFPTGIATGFLACFLLSIRFLKSMQTEKWEAGVFGGLYYSVMAGVMAGALTSFSLSLGLGHFRIKLGLLLLFAMLGGFIGMLAGIGAWIVLLVIYAAFIKKPLPNKKGM